MQRQGSRFKVQGQDFEPRTTLHLAPRRGQAMLELAVFGSLMVLVLGALVSYAMNSDYNQRQMMDSFRRALGATSPSLHSSQRAPICALASGFMAE